jgi:hypothetical protein
MTVNNNKNTQNNNQNVKVVVNVDAPHRKRRSAPKKPQAPPPPPVQNVVVQPLNTTRIPGFNTPDYFHTALTNQQMILAAMANALERKVNNDYENVAVSAGNVMGGIDATPAPSSASDMSGVEPSAPPMPTEEQAEVNNPTAVEEPVLFAQPKVPDDPQLCVEHEEAGLSNQADRAAALERYVDNQNKGQAEDAPLEGFRTFNNPQFDEDFVVDEQAPAVEMPNAHIVPPPDNEREKKGDVFLQQLFDEGMDGDINLDKLNKLKLAWSLSKPGSDIHTNLDFHSRSLADELGLNTKTPTQRDKKLDVILKELHKKIGKRPLQQS